eukprot:768287_1
MAAAAPTEETKPTTDQIVNETTNTSNDQNVVNVINSIDNNDEPDHKTKSSPTDSISNKHHNSHIQIEGWLLKKSRVLKKWRRRWIVLSGNNLYSYKNEKGYSSDPTETININDIISIKASDNNKNSQYSFDIELDKKLTFTLAA